MAAVGTYRGPERRRQPPPPGALARHFLLGALLVLAVSVLFAVMAAQDVELPVDRAGRLTDIARTGSMALAGAVAALCFARWRIGAETAVLLIGTAVLVLGFVVVGIASIVLPVVKDDDLDAPIMAATRAGGLLVVLMLVVLAIALPEVNTALRGPRIVVLSLLGVGVLTAVLVQFPGTAEVLSFGQRFSLGEADVSTTNRLALAAVWSVLAVVMCVRGLGQGRTVIAWAGLMLLTLALSELIAVEAVVVTDVRLLGAEVLQVLAVGVLLVGIVTDFERNFLDQRTRLFDTVVAMRAVQAQARLGSAITGRRRHDVANALMGLEGAASTLERFYDKLDGEDRRKLADMVAASVGRLRNLSAEDPAKPQPFPLSDVAGRLAAQLSEAGVVVEVNVPSDVEVRVLPEELNEVMDQVGKAVLDGSPTHAVRMSAVRFGETAWLSVEFRPAAAGDGAPAVQVGRLRRLMTPRANQALGRGMDLSVAAHMVKERGGQLIAESVGVDEIAIRLQLPALSELA